jgi:hypothetical protein
MGVLLASGVTAMGVLLASGVTDCVDELVLSRKSDC